jgi:hypothetical protein
VSAKNVIELVCWHIYFSGRVLQLLPDAVQFLHDLGEWATVVRFDLRASWQVDLAKRNFAKKMKVYSSPYSLFLIGRIWPHHCGVGGWKMV